MSMYGFDAGETRALKALKTPEKIQYFLDTEIAYNKEPDGDTIRSPRRVLRDKVAHCLEGAMLAAAALRVQGFPPLLLDFEAVRDDDHVIAVFRQHGHWGAIAKSNYSGLRFREPVYRTLRELAMSYFEHYFNASREKTLRNYSRPVRMSRFDRLGWMTAEDDLWVINDYLANLPHLPLLANGAGRRLGRVDERLFAAGLAGRA
ncbi:MAG: transglutaminase domain-containing protein [Terracidiphilus sp.]